MPTIIYKIHEWTLTFTMRDERRFVVLVQRKNRDSQRYVCEREWRGTLERPEPTIGACEEIIEVESALARVSFGSEDLSGR